LKHGIPDTSQPKPEQKAKRTAKAEDPPLGNTMHTQEYPDSAQNIFVQRRLPPSEGKSKNEQTRHREKSGCPQCARVRQQRQVGRTGLDVDIAILVLAPHTGLGCHGDPNAN
jgi:hypothetical protein